MVDSNPTKAFRQGGSYHEGGSPPREDLQALSGIPSIDGFLRAFICLFVVSWLAGCQGYHPAPERVPFNVPPGFLGGGKVPMPGRWWRSFRNPCLDRLVREAIKANLDLKATWERLVQAEAVARKARAPFYPYVDITSGANRTMKEQGHLYTSVDSLSLGTMASYEVDLWGRIGRAKKAAVYNAMSSRSDYQTAVITLASRITTVYFQIAAQRAQLGLLGKQLELNRTYLDIVVDEYRHGQADALDMLQQKQALEAVRGRIAEARGILEGYRYELAVLLGRPPEGFSVPKGILLPDLPPLPETGIPLELVRRRPDIIGAFYRLRSANEALAVAVAEQYPRLSLDVNTSTSASRANALFEDWLAALAANLTAPVFKGGKLKYEVKRAQATSSQALYDYGQKVLNAFREVEDALAREASQRRLLESLEKQRVFSQDAVNQAYAQYKAGTGDYLRFLTAQISHESLEQRIIDARLRLLMDRVDLYRALAGYPKDFGSREGQ